MVLEDDPGADATELAFYSQKLTGHLGTRTGLDRRQDWNVF
jgi:hypothetical protein